MSEKPPTQIAPSLDDPERQGCWTLYLAGWRAADIEKETGIPASNVRKWVMRYRWAAQKAEIDRARDKLHPPESHPLVKAVASNPKDEMRERYLKNTGQIALEDAEHWANEMNPDERLAAATSIVSLNKMHRETHEIATVEPDARANSHITLSFLNNPIVRELLPHEMKEANVKEITDAQPTE